MIESPTPDAVDARVLSTGQLVDALRAQAKGRYATEAAVELLIGHRTWLRRADFLELIDVAPAFGDDEEVMAAIDWERVVASDLPSSSSEASALAIAGELAGYVSRTALGHLLSPLDDANTVLALRAILHAHRGHEAQPVVVRPFVR